MNLKKVMIGMTLTIMMSLTTMTLTTMTLTTLRRTATPLNLTTRKRPKTASVQLDGGDVDGGEAGEEGEAGGP